jgi:phospholipid/cholesterol/gamma-HCH transport system permease protein
MANHGREELNRRVRNERAFMTESVGAEMAEKPRVTTSIESGNRILFLEGGWAASYADDVERNALELEKIGSSGPVVLDLQRLIALDTLGALLLNRTIVVLSAKGTKVKVQGASKSAAVLLEQINYVPPLMPKEGEISKLIGLLSDIGHSVVSAGIDVAKSTDFLGQVIAVIGRLFLKPHRIRVTSIVAQLENVAFRGVPIIILISFLVGAIVSQQGIFQLNRFGASTFAVNLIGILVLRELGVLLTSIMVAGRSGSAFTAELGSMKMREEIDALRVMGLDPIEILVVPRVIALLVGLPILTFVSDMSALAGGGVVAWIYGGMGIDVYLERLKDAISIQTFLAGLIKAPFMALVIALVACGDGLSVKGSAESLGRQVTDAVVKSIFMVIVVDGIFAIFFASIRF